MKKLSKILSNLIFPKWIYRLKLLSKDEFSSLYISELRQRFPNGEYKVTNELEISGWFNDNEVHHVLVNAFKEYKNAPEELDEIIKDYISSAIALYANETEKVDRNGIVPLIKPTSYINAIKNNGNGTDEKSEFVWEKYNKELIILYVEDLQECMSYLYVHDLINLEIDRESLRSYATKNLRKRLPAIKELIKENIYHITIDGSYEASLILFDEIWQSYQSRFEGDVVIAIPNRDLLLITDSNNLSSMEKLREMVDLNYQRGSYPISNKLYTRKNNRFISR